MRFMFIIHSEMNAAPTPQLMEAMHAMAEREVKAGRMIADGGLAPPSAGAQVRLKSGKLVVMDGPFAETKEVFGGFAIFELPDLAAAIKSAEQFLDLHRRHAPGWEGRCEIRPVAGSQVELIRGGGG
ncbi:MAG TPA: YciI family protein [Caulobacteraceae bacterium]